MDNRKAMLIQLAGAVFAVLVAIVVMIKQRMLMLEECEESDDSDIDIGGRTTDEVTDHEDYASDGHSRPSASQSSRKRPAVSQSSNTSGRKVKRLKEDGTMTQLSEKVREVAEAIKSINDDWHVKVHDALWAFEEEYPSDMLDQAYRFLEKDEFGMKSFALKDEELKHKWLDAFMEKNYLPDGDESDDF